ncbi:SusD/RagB family nutrient-binding outer membrane lipoprotein [Salinimicrobium flavum]|uniref:SusD/RagB family nutrient-binding outer membrane lipoprotein n=1 Tax=Salinimicrobium flavum TaxID=1737065 RepID=A0ABW5ITH4_9FLAO
MKKFKIFFSGIAVFSLLFATGCDDDFDEINTNPDTTTQASASLLSTQIILSVARFQGDAKAFISNSALPKYVGYANEGQMGTQYNSIGSSSFGGMNILPDVEKMVEYAEGGQAEDSYKGLAKFARAYMFYHLTMEMGDIPYSETGKGASGEYTPAYDRQEDVFLGILEELEEADQYFAVGESFAGDPTPFNGDPDMWRRATNSLRVKVLMSLSPKAEALNVPSRIQEIVNEGYLFENPGDYWGLEYSTQNPHPLYSTNDLFTSKTILSSHLVDNLKRLNDNRLFYFAEPAGAKLLEGESESDEAAYVGVDVSMEYAQMNAMHSNDEFSLINLRYLTIENSEPRRLLSYAEQQLILAEANIRGWITQGTAEDYYEEGVKAALSYMLNVPADFAHGNPIDQDYINNYFTGEAAFADNEEEQLKQIWMQRYILNFLVDGQTSFFEYRRTNYPEFPINPETSLNENNRNGLPLRWLYPGSEATYNRENLEAALDRQFDGFDEINKKMWLLK